MPTGNVEECYARSIELLRKASTDHGFVASAAYEHYAGVWTRDAALACLGANRSGDARLVETSRRTLKTLGDHSSPSGQVPAAVWMDRNHWDWGEAGCTDASAWFIVVAADYLAATQDSEFVKGLWPRLKGAFRWLQSQDSNNMVLINSPEAGDWMDSSLSRSGKVFHVNVLYYWAAQGLERIATATGADVETDLDADSAHIARWIDHMFWPEADRRFGDLLSHRGHPGEAVEWPHWATQAGFAKAAATDRRFYLSHVIHGAFVDRCDVLANLLAIVTGLAIPGRADRLLDYLEDAGTADPYPSKSWPQPVTQDDDPWGMWKRETELVIAPQWRNAPFEYHNGAVWPYIGAIHALALWYRSRHDAAYELLERCAAGNRVGGWGFHEWLHGRTGKPGGPPDQTWNAGAFVLAYRALEDGLNPAEDRNSG